MWMSHAGQSGDVSNNKVAHPDLEGCPDVSVAFHLAETSHSVKQLDSSFSGLSARDELCKNL